MRALLRPLLTYTRKLVRVAAPSPHLPGLHRTGVLASPAFAPRAAGTMSQAGKADTQPLDAVEDLYGGVIVQADALPSQEDTFKSRLKSSLAVCPIAPPLLSSYSARSQFDDCGGLRLPALS